MTTAQITAGEYGEKSIVYYWDPIGLQYVVGTQPAGGGGGGAVTVADGADVTAGAKADLVWDGAAAAVTAQGLRRYMSVKLEAIRALVAGTLTVSGTVTANAGTGTLAVSLATNTPDVTDRSARLLGTIANTAFTANAGTNLNTSALALDATLTGGTAKAIARTAAKGTALAADLTSNPVDANTQALHVNLAGTNAVNATLSAETTKVIGTVNLAAAQTLATVTNLAQLAGTAPVMKAASTPAAAADAALVVAISPNSPGIPPSTTYATATGLANAAVTLTLSAAGAGLFHYITSLHIARTATAALAGTATLVITSTNIPGSPAWSVGNAMTAGGTQNDVVLVFHSPIKTTTANTATTIVAPVPGAAVLWRLNATYYTGP